PPLKTLFADSRRQRHSFRVGHVNKGFYRRPTFERIGYPLPIEIAQRELGSPKHIKTLSLPLAPGEVDKAISGFALHKRAAKVRLVRLHILMDTQRNREADFLRVCGNVLDHL